MTILAEDDALEVHKSIVRNVAYLDGDPILAVTKELECHAWFAIHEAYLPVVVLGQEADDTAMVTYADFYRPTKVPVAYLRTSASIEALLVFKRATAGLPTQPTRLPLTEAPVAKAKALVAPPGPASTAAPPGPASTAAPPGPAFIAAKKTIAKAPASK